ncbi:MAG: NmrA family NAD(P)-binding protein [Chloroflexota bacterium]
MNNATKRKILVYGGTGSQARPTVLHLVKNGHEPYVLTRHPEKAADLRDAGAKIVIGDLSDPASLRAASQGMDGVALLIPAFLENPLEAAMYGRSAIDAAQEAGVGLIVWNTSAILPETRTGNPMGDLPLELREYLVASQVPAIIFEPTVYMENWLGPWTASALVRHNQVAYPILADRKVGWLASDDIGALVAAALARPDLAGSRFKVSGVEAPMGPELATLFSEALGREISYYAMSPEEMGEAVAQFFGPEAGAALAERYRKDQTNPNPAPMYYAMEPILEQLPVQMTPIKEWVTRHAAAFRS